jgi:hypothetical protein
MYVFNIICAFSWNKKEVTVIYELNEDTASSFSFINKETLYRGADKSLAQPDLKKLKVAIFCPMQRSLLLRRPGWMDNLLNLF